MSSGWPQARLENELFGSNMNCIPVFGIFMSFKLRLDVVEFQYLLFNYFFINVAFYYLSSTFNSLLFVPYLLLAPLKKWILVSVLGSTGSLLALLYFS